MNKKKTMLAVAAFTLLSGFSVWAKAPYTDLGVLQDRSAVDYLYDTQCLDFVQGNQFLPQQVLTRGDLAQLIYSTALNLSPSDTVFSDAPSQNANDAMSAVAAQGILAGYEDGTFHPDQLVTREEFAAVLYRYMQYCGLSDVDSRVPAYADESDIAPENLQAVRYLQAEHLMNDSTDNRFRPKDGITRAEAAETIYHMMHSEGDYVSHVDVENQVIRALQAEYGSMPAFFQQGTLYWDDDTLVIGLKGAPHMFLRQRLKRDVDRQDAIAIRRVRFSRADYDQLLNRAVNCIVSSEGVENYVGSVPDFKNEKIDLIVRRPVSEKTQQELDKRVGTGIVELHDIRTAALRPAAPVAKTEETTEDKEEKPIISYSPLYDEATNQAIDAVIRDARK